MADQAGKQIEYKEKGPEKPQLVRVLDSLQRWVRYGICTFNDVEETMGRRLPAMAVYLSLYSG